MQPQPECKSYYGNQEFLVFIIFSLRLVTERLFYLAFTTLTAKKTAYHEVLLTKEVCNRGVACSLLELGSLEKIVITSLFHSGLHSGTIFMWKKCCHMLFWGTTGCAVF